jgi:NitT/TauT family transport system permease protein
MHAKRLITKLTPYITLLLLIVVWQIATWFFAVPDWLLPSPAVVLNRTEAWLPALPLHVGVTLLETLAGFIVALIIGVPLAMLIVSSTTIRDSIYPILVLLQVVPKIAIAPLFLIWVGYGLGSKVLMAFLVAFFPIVVGTAAGLESVPSELLDMSRVLKATKFQIFLGIRLPWALPHLFSGMKVAVSLALIGAIIGEFVGSDTGLGYVILAASGNMNTGLMFGAIVILAVMGIVLFDFIERLERWLCPWYTTRASAVQAAT